MDTPDFSALPDQPFVASYLQRMIKTQAIPSALLFSGPSHDILLAYAKEFAKALVGAHTDNKAVADIHIYKPEGKLALHSMESVQRLIEMVYLPPYVSQRKCVIISQADRMWPYSSNSLLKTLEEPLNTSLIIMLSENSTKIINTLLSRCIKISFSGGLKNVELDSVLLSLFIRCVTVTAYSELLLVIQEIDAHIEELAKVQLKIWEDEQKIPKKELIASLKEAREKEGEGVVAFINADLQNQLLEAFLYWFRDLHLLSAFGDKRYLRFEAQKEILNSYLKDSFPPLNLIDEKVAEAKMQLERALPFAHVLESLIISVRKVV